MIETPSTNPVAMLVPVLLGFLLGFATVAALDLGGQVRDVRQALLEPVGLDHKVAMPALEQARSALAMAMAGCRLA